MPPSAAAPDPSAAPVSDADLLRAYARDRSEPAFTALVRRHLDLVYSVAHRQLGANALAADVAQSVFLDLARSAAALRPEPSLVAWLHTVTRRTVVDVIRREARRRTREHTAVALTAMDSPPSAWPRLAPLLDDALARLSDADRTAILLRYFEDKSLREVGAALRLSDDAAQKRLSRALDKLRATFARRGLPVTAATLAAEFSAHAITAAPATLASTIATTVFAPAAALTLTSSVSTLVMTTTQKFLIAATVVALLGGGLYEARVIARQAAELSELRQQATQLEADLAALRRDRAAQAAELADARAKATKFAAVDPEIEAALDDWLQNVVRLKAQLAKYPRSQIPELRFLTAKDWLDATKETKLDTELQVRRALSELRLAAKMHFLPKLHEATELYLAAHNGEPPADPTQLAAFFAEPLDPAILPRYGKVDLTGKETDMPHVINRDGKPASWAITEREPVDDYYDYTISVTASATITGGNSKYDVEVDEATDAFKKANANRAPTTAAQLVPYLHSTIDPTFVQEHLDRRP